MDKMISLNLDQEYRKYKKELVDQRKIEIDKLREEELARSEGDLSKISEMLNEEPIDGSRTTVHGDYRIDQLTSCSFGTVQRSTLIFQCTPPSIDRSMSAFRVDSDKKMAGNHHWLNHNFRMALSDKEDTCPISKFYRLLNKG